MGGWAASARQINAIREANRAHYPVRQSDAYFFLYFESGSVSISASAVNRIASSFTTL